MELQNVSKCLIAIVKEVSGRHCTLHHRATISKAIAIAVLTVVWLALKVHVLQKVSWGEVRSSQTFAAGRAVLVFSCWVLARTAGTHENAMANMHRKMTMSIVVWRVEYHRIGTFFCWKAGCPFQKAFGNALVPHSDHSEDCGTGGGLDVGNRTQKIHVGTVDPMSPALETSSNLNYPLCKEAINKQWVLINKPISKQNAWIHPIGWPLWAPSFQKETILSKKDIIQVKTPVVELLDPVTGVRFLRLRYHVDSAEFGPKFQGLFVNQLD